MLLEVSQQLFLEELLVLSFQPCLLVQLVEVGVVGIHQLLSVEDVFVDGLGRVRVHVLEAHVEVVLEAVEGGVRVVTTTRCPVDEDVVAVVWSVENVMHGKTEGVGHHDGESPGLRQQ